MVLVLCLVKPTHCMNISSGGGSCIVNGRIFGGNSICIVNGQTYIDGVLQADDGVGSTESSWGCRSDESKSFSVNTNSRIRIKNSIGGIDVLGHDGMNATLFINKLGATDEDLRHVVADISQTAETLEIETNYLKPVVRALIHYRLLLPKINKFSCSFTNSSGDTSIEEIDGDVYATSMSGKINAQRIIGVTQAKTSSGDMNLDTIKGSVIATTQSGKMKAKGIDGCAQFTSSSSGDMDIDTVSQLTHIKTASGTLEVKNIAATLVAFSSSGDMHISNVAGNFMGGSTSGRISAKGIKGNSAIDTSSGDITCDADEEFQGTSTSGNIKLFKTHFCGWCHSTINAPITITTSSGDIEICSDTFDARLVAETSSGDLSSDFALPVRKNSISTQVGNGGYSVSLKTSSGNITLTKN